MIFTKYRYKLDYHWKEFYRGTKYKRHALRILNWVKEKAVLDIGCGDGMITFLLGAVGVDDEQSGIDIAKQKGVDVLLASCYKLPFEDGVFDSALMADVLEHLDKPEEALREARRVITDYLYITTPPANITPGKLLDKFHVQEWSPEELKTLVEGQGFELVGDIEVVMEEKNMYSKFRKKSNLQQ